METKLNEAAWQRVCLRSDSWDLQMLQREWNRIDWSLLSQNKYIRWTAEMINLCKDQLDWHLFSKYAQLPQEQFLKRVSRAILAQYEDRWDWFELFNRRNARGKQPYLYEGNLMTNGQLLAEVYLSKRAQKPQPTAYELYQHHISERLEETYLHRWLYNIATKPSVPCQHKQTAADEPDYYIYGEHLDESVIQTLPPLEILRTMAVWRAASMSLALDMLTGNIEPILSGYEEALTEDAIACMNEPIIYPRVYPADAPFPTRKELQREEEERKTKAMIGHKLSHWETAERMAEKLDWRTLSSRMEVELSYEFLNKLAHRVDWLRIINRFGWTFTFYGKPQDCGYDPIYSWDFLERYRAYITDDMLLTQIYRKPNGEECPPAPNQGSALWHSLTHQRATEMGYNFPLL